MDAPRARARSPPPSRGRSPPPSRGRSPPPSRGRSPPPFQARGRDRDISRTTLARDPPRAREPPPRTRSPPPRTRSPPPRTRSPPPRSRDPPPRVSARDRDAVRPPPRTRSPPPRASRSRSSRTPPQKQQTQETQPQRPLRAAREREQAERRGERQRQATSEIQQHGSRSRNVDSRDIIDLSQERQLKKTTYPSQHKHSTRKASDVAPVYREHDSLRDYDRDRARDRDRDRDRARDRDRDRARDRDRDPPLRGRDGDRDRDRSQPQRDEFRSSYQRDSRPRDRRSPPRTQSSSQQQQEQRSREGKTEREQQRSLGEFPMRRQQQQQQQKQQQQQQQQGSMQLPQQRMRARASVEQQKQQQQQQQQGSIAASSAAYARPGERGPGRRVRGDAHTRRDSREMDMERRRYESSMQQQQANRETPRGQKGWAADQRRGPGLQAREEARWVDDGTRYFLIESFDLENIMLSRRENIWAAKPENKDRLNDAFKKTRRAVLVFIVAGSGSFFGCAVLNSALLHDPSKDSLWSSSRGGQFNVTWKATNQLFYRHVADLFNPRTKKRVIDCRDGDEIDPRNGSELCKRLGARLDPLPAKRPRPYEGGNAYGKRQKGNMNNFRNAPQQGNSREDDYYRIRRGNPYGGNQFHGRQANGPRGRKDNHADPGASTQMVHPERADVFHRL
eukprot:CAMPEP_0197542420 /NCGR_PEP_ID=MMETSP1318-20131121/67694_1 /TAXON_ID=552666 /ORGANISM="Partenskyella glossopodia, Strain RCC365" /LENGTH=675 /DNA_ID=CAMNT_0043101681 /DNA_START=1192 /DNA_END=3220 /DNA_ORIENTATION=+